jgi:DNA-binding protein
MSGGRYRPSREHVIVGTKPTMNYVVACVTLFNSGTPRLMVRARGRNISKAVEVVEMLRRVFLKDAKVDDIQLGTEVHTPPHGKEVSVSTIEIVVKNPKTG